MDEGGSLDTSWWETVLICLKKAIGVGEWIKDGGYCGRRTSASGINGHQTMDTGHGHAQQGGMVGVGCRFKVHLGEGWHEKRKSSP